MLWNASRCLAAAILFTLSLPASPVRATTETVVPVLDIGKGASLAAGGNALMVPIEVQCSARWEVLEAFVSIVQNSTQSANAPIPVDCGMDRPRHYNVQVNAGQTPFEQGEATATAYVLLQDPDNGATMPLNDTATILIRALTHKSGAGEP
jgi:hypothetical protein